MDNITINCGLLCNVEIGYFSGGSYLNLLLLANLTVNLYKINLGGLIPERLKLNSFLAQKR